MNKKTGLWIALDLIFVIVFNVIFFTICGGKQPASVWIAYVIIHFAFIMVVITPFIIRKGRDAQLFGNTIALVSSIYFVVTLIAGIIIIVIQPKTVKWTIIIEILMAGIYGGLLLINMLANEHTADVTEKQKIQIQYVRGCSARLYNLMSIISDKKLLKKLEKAYDIVHTSSVQTSPSSQRYEVEVLTLLDTIEDDIAVNDFEAAERATDALIKAANRRNTLV